MAPCEQYSGSRSGYFVRVRFGVVFVLFRGTFFFFVLFVSGHEFP